MTKKRQNPVVMNDGSWYLDKLEVLPRIQFSNLGALLFSPSEVFD